MAKQTINLGSVANDGTGDDLRAGGDKINDNFDELYTAALAMQWVPNFTGDGETRVRADVAMTVTEQATSGTGTITYEKSTTAAPSTFNSTTSPIALQAGAWLKVIAADVVDIVAVHLKRTA